MPDGSVNQPNPNAAVPMPSDLRVISVRGAREHNLKNVNIDIPRDQLVVITGLSGSGKSSLAFDTIYAEGQRRYVESLSAYARQCLELLEKPDVDSIEGLSPAISIVWAFRTRRPRGCPLKVRPSAKWLTALWQCKRERAFIYWLQSCEGGRANIARKFKTFKNGAFSELRLMVSCT